MPKKVRTNTKKVRALFPVASIVCIGFAFFALLRAITNPFVRPVEVNKLGDDPAFFLKAAGSEPIEWHRLTSNAIAIAKREQKPILLVLGNDWNPNQRYFDSEIFTDDSVARLIAHQFLAIRVDTDAEPSWQNAYLPYSRVPLGLDPQFQVIVLSPDGKLIDVLGALGLNYRPDAGDFTGILGRAASDFNAYQTAKMMGRDYPLKINEQQLQDINIAKTSPPSMVRFDLIKQKFASTIDLADYEGFPLPKSLPLTPDIWQFISESLGPALGQQAVAKVIESPCVDWIRGGFFNGSTALNWMSPRFDKSTILQAEMAQVLARLAVLNNNSFDKYLAVETDKNLLKFAISPGEILPVSIIGKDNGVFNRSPNYSASPALLRNIFPNLSDRNWVWDFFNLRVDSNPIAVPYVKGSASFNPQDPNFTRCLGLLQKALPEPKPEDFETLSVNATADARIFQTAMMLGDSSLIISADELYNDLGPFVKKNDVVHSIQFPEYSSPSLCDYLAYADASLQDFRALGRVSSLNSGFAVLNRGLFLFQSRNHLGFNSGTDTEVREELPGTLNPAIVDDLGESDMAKVVRLCTNYGQMFENSTNSGIRAKAMVLLEIASGAASKYDSLAESILPRSSGFIHAAVINQTKTFCVAIGKNPVAMEQKLVQKGTTLPVYPAIAEVWPSLQNKPSGYYVIQDDSSSGPLSLSQAYEAMGGDRIP